MIVLEAKIGMEGIGQQVSELVYTIESAITRKVAIHVCITALHALAAMLSAAGKRLPSQADMKDPVSMIAQAEALENQLEEYHAQLKPFIRAKSSPALGFAVSKTVRSIAALHDDLARFRWELMESEVDRSPQWSKPYADLDAMIADLDA